MYQFSLLVSSGKTVKIIVVLLHQKVSLVRDVKETMVLYNNAIYLVVIFVLLLDYYRSSAICTECLVVPLTIIVAVLFILLTLYGLIRKGISISQLTQVCSYIVDIANYITIILCIKLSLAL